MTHYCCFPGFVILPVRMHLTVCLVFCLVMIFLLKLLRLKIYFHDPSGLGRVPFLILELIVKAKRRKLSFHMNLLKAFIFQHGQNLKLIFLKSKAQVIKLMLCDRKDKHEVEEHLKVLAPILDTIVTLGRLGLSFRGHCDDSKYHPKVREYSTVGVGNFVEFLQFKVRSGNKVWQQHLKTCSKNASYISKT